MSFLVAVGTSIKTRVSHMAGVEQFVLALGAFAFTLVISNIVVPYIKKLRYTKCAGLQFYEWHGGSARNFPPVDYGYPSWVSVLNP